MITNTEGQHTAHVAGSQQDAVDRADLQLTACGGGRLIIDDPDEH
ncbi:hypothetical protein [Saccharopolyspora sp. CA-218241]